MVVHQAESDRVSEIIAQDNNIGSEAKAGQVIREALQRLMDIREENDLPKICPT